MARTYEPSDARRQVQNVDVVYQLAADERAWLTDLEIAEGWDYSARAARKRTDELVEAGVLEERIRIDGHRVHPKEYALCDRRDREETAR
jgi:hypothetical protein